MDSLVEFDKELFVNNMEEHIEKRYEYLVKKAEELGELDGIKCRALLIMAAQEVALMGDELNKKIRKAIKEYEYYL
jgi:hypothetical protein